MNKNIPIKTAAIFHGSGGSEDSFWIPWLKRELCSHGYDVWTPSIADHDGAPDLDLWVDKIKGSSKRRDFDLMVGHSSGVPLFLRLLSGEFTVKKGIGVAGYMRPLNSYEVDGLTFDTQVIKQHSQKLIFVHSDNDPWGCTAKNQGEYMRDTLGGQLIVEANEGHFGSNTFNQPYDTFPLLLKLCLSQSD